MSVGETCGPMYSWKFEGSDRPRGCHPGLSVTSPREEGGYGRRDSTWSVRPADARAGFSSVVLAGPPLAVPSRHKRPTGYQPECCGASDAGHEEHKRLGSTTSPPTGNSHDLTSRGSLGPQHIEQKMGVLSA